MPMTSTQRDRLRRDIGDTGATPAFGNDELDDNWDRMSGAADEESQMKATMAKCFEQLLNSAVKLHDYTAGAVDEKLDQVFKHLEKRYAEYKPYMDAALGQKSQVVVGKVGMRAHATRYTPAENDTSGRRR